MAVLPPYFRRSVRLFERLFESIFDYDTWKILLLLRRKDRYGCRNATYAASLVILREPRNIRDLPNAGIC
jgi:hypothetical protein